MFELKTLLLLFFFLLVEIGSLFFLLFALIYQRIFTTFKIKIQAHIRTKISDQIASYLENQRPFVPSPIFSHPLQLLSVLESYNRRIQGEEWESLKKEIAAKYLLKLARGSAKSLFWKKRSFAARVFALAPLPEDEALILRLLVDPVFLVNSLASLAAISLNSKKGIELTLHHMAEKTGYASCYYRDALLQGSTQTFAYMVEIAPKSPEIHLACLEVFSGKTVTCPIPFLEADLRSKDPKIVLAALKVLVRNPLKNSKAIFWEALEPGVHPEEIRVQAAAGLKLFIDPDVLQKLEETLDDPSWKVRLQAALSLTEMGEPGMAILQKQKEKEAAYYALDFLG